MNREKTFLWVYFIIVVLYAYFSFVKNIYSGLIIFYLPLFILSLMFFGRGMSLIILVSSICLVPLWVNTYSLFGIQSFIKLNYPLLSLILFILELLVISIKNRNIKIFNNLDKSIFLFFIYSIFNIFFLGNIEVLSHSYALIFPFLYFFLLRLSNNFNKRLNIKLIYNILIVSSTIEAIILIVIFITRQNPFLPPEERYDINMLDWVWGPIFQPQAAIEPTNGVVILCLASLIAFYMNIVYKKKYYLFPLIILITGTYFTLSRTGFFLVFLTIITLFLIYSKKIKSTKIRIYILTIIIIIFVIIPYFIYINFAQDLIRKIESTTTHDKIESQIKPALNALLNDPLKFMIGIGYEKWRISQFPNKSMGGPIHQTHLSILIEMGLIGFILWIRMFWVIVKVIKKDIRKIKYLNKNECIRKYIQGYNIILGIILFFLGGILQPLHYNFHIYTLLLLLLAFYQNENFNYITNRSKT